MVLTFRQLALIILLAPISHAAVWDPPGNGTLVEVAVYVDDFLGMANVHTQEFRLDLWLMARWKDARVPTPSNGRREIYLDVADEGAAPIWVPKLTFTNKRYMEIQGDHLFANADGTVHRYQRLLADFEANMDFLHFPFDAHTWKLKIEVLDAFVETVELSPWIGPFGNKSHAPPSGRKSEAKSLGMFSWEWQSHGQDCLNVAAEGGICDPSGFILLARKTKPPFSGAKFQGATDGACVPETSGASLTDTSYCDTDLPRKFSEGSLQCMCELPKKSRVEVLFSVARRTDRLQWNYFVPCYVCWFVGYVSHFADPSDFNTRLSATVLSLLTFEFLSERAKGYYPQTEQLMWINAFHNLNLFFLVALVANNVQIAWVSRRCSSRVSVDMNRCSRVVVLVALSAASFSLFLTELEDAEQMNVLNNLAIAFPLATTLIITARFLYGMWTLDRDTIWTAFFCITEESTIKSNTNEHIGSEVSASIGWFGMMLVYGFRLWPARYTEIDDNELLHLWETVCLKAMGYRKLAQYVDSTTASLSREKFCEGVQNICNKKMFKRMATLNDDDVEASAGQDEQGTCEKSTSSGGDSHPTQSRSNIEDEGSSRVEIQVGKFRARIERRGLEHVNFDYFKAHYRYLLFGDHEATDRAPSNRQPALQKDAGTEPTRLVDGEE